MKEQGKIRNYLRMKLEEERGLSLKMGGGWKTKNYTLYSIRFSMFIKVRSSRAFIEKARNWELEETSAVWGKSYNRTGIFQPCWGGGNGSVIFHVYIWMRSHLPSPSKKRNIYFLHKAQLYM